MRQIEIKNVKHMAHLIFDIPEPGLHLLSGKNGAGKTSLLAALHRIGDRNAFPKYFKPSSKSKLLDNFDKAEFIYHLGTETVNYGYAGERWTPRPRANSDLLKKFGYHDVLYIGATADRITPNAEDFEVKRIRFPSLEEKDTANEIFSTDKFNHLRIISLTRGNGYKAYLMQATPAPKATYYSEKNFSLGEICVLKMIRRLRACKKNSLILIDELELALHPKAQIKLLDYLKKIAVDKNLTIIFSTHSITLLKSTPKKNIIFLEHENNAVKASRGVYPSYAIGHMSSPNEKNFDLIIYTEDVSAATTADTLLTAVVQEKYKDKIAAYPSFQVIPIGPFISVVRHLAGSDAVIPDAKTFALLDADVKSETLVQWRNNQEHQYLAEFQRWDQRIRYLPWTPEVGLFEYLKKANFRTQISVAFKIPGYTIAQADLDAIPLQAGSAQREACKKLYKKVAADIKGLKPRSNPEEKLLELFAIEYFKDQKAAVLQLFGPLL